MKLEGRSITAGHGRQRLDAILVAAEVAMRKCCSFTSGRVAS